MLGLFAQAGVFLLTSLCGFLTILLLLRFYMQWLRVPFNHPLGHFVLQLTGWLVIRLRRVIRPAFGLDLASLIPACLLQAISVMAPIFIYGNGVNFVQAYGFIRGVSPEIALLFLLGHSVLALLRINVYLFIGLLLLQAVLSWTNPGSPLASPIHQLTQPVLRPLRRIIPLIGHIDLSPLAAILLAQVVLIFLQ